MACGRTTIKICLSIINTLFLIVGFGLIALGLTIIAVYSPYGHKLLTIDTALLPAIIVFVVGILVLLLAVIGFTASCSKQKCCAGLFFTFALVTFLGLVCASVLAFFYHSEIDTRLHEIISDGLQNYLSDDDVRTSVDLLQSLVHCCGVENYTDWQKTPWYEKQTNHSHLYPESCCVDKNCKYTSAPPANDTSLYQEGCYEKLRITFKSHLVIILAVGGSFAILLLIGMILSCGLVIYKQRRTPQDIPYTGIPQSDGFRV